VNKEAIVEESKIDGKTLNEIISFSLQETLKHCTYFGDYPVCFVMS
jgi:hypothetical protein